MGKLPKSQQSASQFSNQMAIVAQSKDSFNPSPAQANSW